jgi:molecular chaperone GrpE
MRVATEHNEVRKDEVHEESTLHSKENSSKSDPDVAPEGENLGDEASGAPESSGCEPEGVALERQQSEDMARMDEEDTKGSEETTVNSERARLQAEIDTLKQQLLRVHADFDNFRKRTRQEREELQQFATRRLLEDLLPTVDNFERALSSFTDDAQADMKKGIEMVYRQLVGVLEKYGVEAMDTTDAKFDPNLHEAVMQEPADGREVGVIVQELQKGYTLHGRVLRPAMVKVTV